MTQQTDELIAIVTDVLNQFGMPMSFIRTSEGTYDPTTATTDEPITAIYTGIGFPWPYSKYERANSLVQLSDNRLIVNKMTFVPMVGDEVTFRETSYRVTRIEQITMSNEDIAWILEVII